MKSTVRISIGAVLFIAFIAITWALSNNGLQAQTPDEMPVQQEQIDAFNKIEPLVLTQIETSGQTEFFIRMTEKADLSPAYDLQTKEEKGQFVFDTLRETAMRTQAELLNQFDKSGIEYRSYYIANKILVHGGNQILLMDIAARADVAQITANHAYQLQDPFKSPEGASPLAVETNITFINADDVWSLGYTGNGIVLAGNDTGLDETHPTILPHYRGCQNPPTCSIIDHNYNWWDATNTYPNDPFDGHGHGTHTTGTMVGDDGGANQIGVAPGAQTVHCKNMTDGGGGSDITFSTCFEWDLAPWDLNGANPRPDLAPDAINNSWGYDGGGQTQFRDEIAALQAAGILVELSAGNSGPGCSSLGSPGDYQEVLTTGSVNHASGSMPGIITGFSSRGPSSLDGNYFPDIMAPGENIRSALPGNRYASWGGTSMAGPHVTALVGLMWSANPALRGNIADTVDIIKNTAVPLTGQNGSSCGGDYTTGPNNDWGFGTIDALAAVQEVMRYGAVGALNGIVTDSSNSNPIEGAMINATLSPTQTWGAATNATGVYTVTLITGTYHVAASAFGYLPAAVSNVEIVSGTTTVQDFALTPATIYTVDGYVTDVNTGWPLYANLAIDGYPGDAIWTDPVSGYYSISLPAGIAYTFNVNAWVSGYMSENRDVGPLTANTTEDFAPDADTAICTAPGYSENNIFYDGFESGDLSAGWIVTTTVNGRVQVSTDDPYLGNYSVLLDSAVDDSYSDAGIILPIDLSGEPQVDLSFWWHEYSDEDDPKDGVFISDDSGATWCEAFSFNGGLSSYQKTELDLTTIATSCSMTMGANSQILFRFYDNYRINTDGYTIDEVKLFAGATVCKPPADGGLLVGNVYDDNTGNELNSAEVASAGGEVATTFATPADANLDDGFFTIFSPSGSHTFTATMSGGYGADVETLTIANGGTVSQSFNLPAGVLVATPDNFHVTLDMGDSVTNTLTLTNSGGRATAFELRERDGGFVPVLNLPVYTAPSVTANPSRNSSYSGGDYQIPSDSNDSYAQAPKRYAGPNALMYYGDRPTFDADNPGLPLENFGNTLVLPGAITGCPGPFNSATNDVCFTPGGILDGISLANDPPGDMIVIGSGALGNPDVLVGPNTFADDHDITFPNGDIYVVGFDLWSPNGAAAVDIYIYGPGDVLLAQTSVVATTTGAFWGVVSSELITRIHTNAPGGDGELFTNISFGDVTSDIPWLSEDPITGTIASLSSVNIDVTFDAGVPEITQPGDYLAELRVDNDSPYGNPRIPITMTVLVPASFGKLEGAVTGLGYCDADPAALEDAEVLVEDSVGVTTTLITDAAGYYSFWIDEARGPVTVTATALEHESGMTTGVAITRQVTTTVDVDLRWLQPCVSATPDTLEVTLLMGDNTTVPLNIDNAGAVSTTFELVENLVGFAPVLLLDHLYPHMSVPYWDNTETAPDELLNGILTWGTGADIPTGARYRAAGATCDGQSYYVMGGSSGILLDEAWNYEPASDTWTQLADLPVALMNFDAACLDGFVYLVGGYDRGSHTNNFQIYDIAADSWTATTWANARTPMTAVYDGLLYAFGGNPGPSAETWVYDPAAGTWTQLADMPTANSYGTATTVGDYIYQIGGGLSNTVQRYDPANDTWDNSGPQLQDSRMSALSAWYGDYIYVVSGGGSGGGFWDAWATTEVYDASQWPAGSWAYDDENVGTPVVAPAGDCAADSIWGAGGTSGGTPYATNQHLDDGMTCHVSGSGNDVPWLSEDPITGTLASLSSVNIDVTFDAGVPEITQPGDYLAELRVDNDSPYGNPRIPITMTVLVPASFGKLEGAVTGLGYCDADPAALEDAEVIVEDSVGITTTLITDAAGYYSFWIDEAVSPVTVTVTAMDHESGMVAGIAISSQMTTTANFDLRWLEPCVSTTPDALAITLLQGNSITVGLGIDNAGAISTTFKLVEKLGGFAPVLISAPVSTSNLVVVEEAKGDEPETIGFAPVGSGGPDGFGYTYIDSFEAGGPDFEWIEIAPPAGGSGLPAGLTGIDDGYVFPVTMSFPFNFYGTDYVDLAFGSNGTVYFEDVYLGYGNNAIPGDSGYGVNTFLAHFWDDLVVTGEVYYQDFGDMFVVEYYNIRLFGGSTAGTWQIIFYDDGNILMQYLDVTFSDGSGATFGIQGDTATGLQYAHNSSAVSDSLSICFIYPDNNLCGSGADIPWLSEDPITGTVSANNIINIDVTFDTMTYTLGTYTGTLKVRSDDPVNGDIEVPITMHVVSFGVDIAPATAAITDTPGTMVTYTLQVTNTGNITDTFDLAPSGNSWTVAASPTSVTLAAGDSATVMVTVNIPAGATDGDSDVVTVTATSQGDGSKTAVSTLTTTAKLISLYLPVIMKP